ncbi:non-oxidative hydroxyarylic acid decarboxylases subunit B [Streptomyces bobili]|uniref:non-oxidative hydroxyarylic acid decarboxylases subunit B n=1 Tax=Streptomyces bobili TaxID=67280 RepID=UPI0034229ECE
MRKTRLVVAVTGATGAALGVRLLEELRLHDTVEVHLVVSRWARSTLKVETGLTAQDVAALAEVSYSPDDQAAAISSGSFPAHGMIVIPCSMKTLAAIRTGYADGLVARAADVTLKERRKLVLVPRETPLSDIHLENLLSVSRMGAVILPPMLTFYNRPSTIEDMVDHIVARVLDQFGMTSHHARRWQGLPNTNLSAAPAGIDSRAAAANVPGGTPI